MAAAWHSFLHCSQPCHRWRLVLVLRLKKLVARLRFWSFACFAYVVLSQVVPCCASHSLLLLDVLFVLLVVPSPFHAAPSMPPVLPTTRQNRRPMLDHPNHSSMHLSNHHLFPTRPNPHRNPPDPPNPPTLLWLGIWHVWRFGMRLLQDASRLGFCPYPYPFLCLPCPCPGTCHDLLMDHHPVPHLAS